MKFINLAIRYSAGFILTAITLVAQSSDISYKEKLYYKRHRYTWTSTIDIAEGQQLIGTMNLKYFRMPLVYELFDDNQQKVAHTTSSTWGKFIDFEFFDEANQSLGRLKEDIFSYYINARLYSQRDDKPQIEFIQNFWGNTFYLYDGITHEELGWLYKPIFTFSDYLEFHVYHPVQFAAKHLDARMVLMATAMQWDTDIWYSAGPYGFTIDKSYQANLAATIAESKTLVEAALSKLPVNVLSHYSIADSEAIMQRFHAIEDRPKLTKDNSIVGIKNHVNRILDLLEKSDFTDDEKALVLSQLLVRLDAI